MLETDLITICEKNQAPQVSFKNYVARDLISNYSHEFADMKFCDFLDSLDATSYYESHTFSLHGPMPYFLSYMVVGPWQR